MPAPLDALAEVVRMTRPAMRKSAGCEGISEKNQSMIYYSHFTIIFVEN